MTDLAQMLESLASEGAKAAEKEKAKRAKDNAAKAKERAKLAKLRGILNDPVVFRQNRLDSSRWVCEALVMIVSEGQCVCGKHYEYPHQRLFVKRYHPLHGIHMEALGHRPVVSSLPFHIERDVQALEVCPACMTQDIANAMQAQMMLPLYNTTTVAKKPQLELVDANA